MGEAAAHRRLLLGLVVSKLHKKKPHKKQILLSSVLKVQLLGICEGAKGISSSVYAEEGRANVHTMMNELSIQPRPDLSESLLFTAGQGGRRPVGTGNLPTQPWSGWQF